MVSLCVRFHVTTLFHLQSNPSLDTLCYERTEVQYVSWTSLPVSEGTEGNSLRIAKRIALANELERDKESSWDLTSQNARVVAK